MAVLECAPPETACATWYLVTGGNSDIWWRCEAPAAVLGAQVHLIHDDDRNILHTSPRAHWPDRFTWFVRPDGTFHYPNHAGTAIWTRPDKWRALHGIAMQERGIRALAEVDDNYLSRSSLNMFMRANEYGDEERVHHLDAFCVFDGVVFSTEWLRDRYTKELRSRSRKIELFVAHNNVPDDQWPEPIPYRGSLRVGWMGSAQHARDIKLAGQAFQWAREMGCVTILMGHDVRDQTGLRSERALDETRAWAELIDHHIPWVDPAEYHRLALPFDIGLAPLELNDHTLGKSDIKAVEYAISGAVPVVSAHPVYTKYWRHNETCLVASSRDEFAHCVAELIRSPSLRRRLVSAAQQYVREERGSAQIREEWGRAISG